MPTSAPEPPDTHPPEHPLAEMAVRQAERQFEAGLKDRPPQPALVLQRAQRIHEAHRRRALQVGIALEYTSADLRRFISRKLAAGGCPYCRRPLTSTTFTVTHKNPPRRGGRHALVNLIVCCADCRALKGPLDAQEFQELVLLMRNWPEPVRRLFLAHFRKPRRPHPPDTPRAA